MRFIGLDYGEKRIGVAVSDPLGIIVRGIGVISRSDSIRADIAELKNLISQYENIDEIVIGLPKTLKGEIGIAAEKALRFAKALKSEFSAKITAWDERLTTAQAEKAMINAGLSREKRKQLVDQSAAALILQNYLDSKKQ